MRAHQTAIPPWGLTGTTSFACTSLPDSRRAIAIVILMRSQRAEDVILMRAQRAEDVILMRAQRAEDLLYVGVGPVRAQPSFLYAQPLTSHTRSPQQCRR